jgi:hypothetical protein
MATDKVAAKKNGSAYADEETKGGIYEGLNTTQLMMLFKRDFRTIQKGLYEASQAGVKPAGKRYGADIYAVHEVAPYLTKPVFDVEGYIRRMDHKDLPKMLTKEFWAGQRSKQDYEEKAGLLWRTEKVVQEMGELFKLVKMSTLLMSDAVERQAELSDRQREIIKTLTHGMLDDLVKRIEEKFKVPANEHQEAVEDEEL